MDNLLIIRQDGLWRGRFERVAEAEQLLSRIAENSANVVPKVALFEGRPVNLARTRTAVTLGVELPEVAIQTYYALNPTGDAIIPVYSRGDLALRQTRTWRVPPELKFHFFLHREEGGVTLAFVVLQHRETRRCYQPPLGNIYPDSHVCMGEAWRPREVADRTLIEQLGEAITWYRQSETNTDLIGGAGGGSGRRAGSDYFLRWDPATDEQLPVADLAHGLTLLSSASHHAWAELINL